MEPVFSIIIPSWNNLPYLKVCVDSIRKNSAYPHQIIVHVNEGTDGTLEWVQNEGLDYTFSERNIGVCQACNMMRTRVKTNYIFYLNVPLV
jgi:GT2 family glycosyltransferase